MRKGDSVTTQPSDWAVARAFAEYRLVAHYSAVTMIQSVEARARELDASGGVADDSLLSMVREEIRNAERHPRKTYGLQLETLRRIEQALATPRAAEAATTNSAQISSSLVVGGDDGWLPIESYRGPDGHMHTVLLFWPGTGVREGYFCVDEEFADRPAGWRSPESGWRGVADQCIPINQPTMWRPLPAPPQAAMTGGLAGATRPLRS